MNKIRECLTLLAIAISSVSGLHAQQTTYGSINYTHDIENICVKDFIDNVTYTFGDESKVLNYYSVDPYKRVSRKDHQSTIASPYSARTDLGLKLSGNYVPGNNYPARMLNESGTNYFNRNLIATGRVRFIDTENKNVRDFGGWNTIEGKKVKYELIYRGSQVDYLPEWTTLSTIGIKAELDLRNDDEISKCHPFVISGTDYKGVDYDKLVEDVDYKRVDIGINEIKNEQDVYIFQYLTVAQNKRELFRECFQYILAELKADKPVYFHCKIGCDRAGTLALLLEGTLGLSYSDIIKDYELSTMSGNVRTKDRIDPLMDYIVSLDGNNLKEKFYTYWLEGLEGSAKTEFKSQLDEFCSLMLTEGTHVHDYCTKHVANNIGGTDGLSAYQCAICGRCEVESFTITDKQPINLDIEFTAASVEYNRAFTTNWATICLPYDFAVPSGYECYWLESVNLEGESPTINFKPITMTNGKYILKAHSAYIIRYSPQVSGTPSASDFNATNVTFVKSANAEAKKGIMEGMVTEKRVFTQEYLDENAQYKFFGLSSNGEFVALGKNSSCAPFRAYFKLDRSLLPSNSNAKIRVSYEEYDYEEFTIIDNVEANNAVDNNTYNLNGQIVDADSYKGIVIRNNKKIINR